MSGPLAYPLSWPNGRPRTSPHERKASAFSRDPGHAPTVARCRRQLELELGRMNVREFILSSNVPLRLDGNPRSGQPEPTDPGVAVYFDFAGRSTVLACDRWATVAENLRAIVKHIDALRGQERWGVGSLEQAFAGYAALPAPGKHSARSWRSVLNFGASTIVTHAEVRARHRELIKLAIGDEAQMRELNVARDEALEELSR